MSRDRCRVCAYPANALFSKNNHRSWLGRSFSYCSEVCQHSEEYRRKRNQGILWLILVIFIFTLSGELSIALVFLPISIAYFIYALILKPEYGDMENIKDRKTQGGRVEMPRDNTGIFPQKDKSRFHMTDEEEDPLIYSEILKKKVKNCCFQSARLNDKYCVCGRALHYPVTY